LRTDAVQLAGFLMAALPLGNHRQPARGIVLAPMLVIASAVFDPAYPLRSRVLLGESRLRSESQGPWFPSDRCIFC
jgi:hypothetical protein